MVPLLALPVPQANSATSSPRDLPAVISLLWLAVKPLARVYRGSRVRGQESFAQVYLDGRANAVWSYGGATTTQASVSLLLAPRMLSCVFRGVGRGRRGRRCITSWRGTIVCGYCSLLHVDVVDPVANSSLLVGSSFLEGM